MISSEEAAERWKAVKYNVDRLHNCPQHQFNTSALRFEGPASLFGRKLRCLSCSGEMDLTRISEYVRGFIAAGGDPETVFPGWNDESGN